jgi:Bifunctional DNA primase/polymerase, N-terminal
MKFNSFLEAALFYASLGWLVFPCQPKGKKPLTSHGLRDATTDPENIKRWWGRWPNANIAIKTGKESGLFVIDIDVADGKMGADSLAELVQKHGPLPETLEALTGTGGQHIYFRYPEDVGIKNSASRVAPDIDVRGEGGYVIAPPSIHPGGGVYKWIG